MQPLFATPYSLVAEQSNKALDVSCTTCVSSAEVDFAWAAGVTKGGAAQNLECSECVSSTDLASGAVASAHLQASAVTSDKVSFDYAGSDTKGGAATDVACPGCVAGSDIAPNAALSGNVAVTGSLAACTANTAGCAVKVSDLNLVDRNDGWLNVEVPGGLRVRDTTNLAYKPVAFGGGTSVGDFSLSGGNLTVSGSTAVGGALNVTGSVNSSGIFGGDGSGLTNLDADKLVYGRLPDGRLHGTYSGNLTFSGDVTFSGTTNLSSGSIAIPVGTVLPAPGAAGSIFFLSTTNSIYVSTGSAWVPVSGAGGSSTGGGTGSDSGNAPPADGLGSSAQPATSCRAIREDHTGPSGLVWLKLANGTPYLAWCDMATAGGGWTLVMQSATLSAYTYDSAVWTTTSAPASNTTNLNVEQDMVSPAFYTLQAEESMPCMGDLSHCAAWDHGSATARSLSNGARMASTVGSGTFCSTFKCPPSALPLALNSATSWTNSHVWHRFGYVNDVNGWGTKTRVGFTGDQDSSDSSDTIIGLGIDCFGSCLSASVTNGAHKSGSGYYLHSAISPNLPHSAPLRAYLFVRDRPSGALVGTPSYPAASCKVIRDARPAAPSGVHSLSGPTGAPYEAYCDMDPAKDGGGWTLVLQASSASAYVQFHSVWTDTAAPLSNVTNATLDQDMVSVGFYTLPGSKSMLCMGDLSHCSSWTHGWDTARNLANGPGISAAQGAFNFCPTFDCGANTCPNNIRNATPGTWASAWHRWGYVNGTNGWGAHVRVGFSGDNDSSDSSDTVIGLGLNCVSSCTTASTTGGVHGKGSGYYMYLSWSSIPHSGALKGYLFIR